MRPRVVLSARLCELVLGALPVDQSSAQARGKCMCARKGQWNYGGHYFRALIYINRSLARFRADCYDCRCGAQLLCNDRQDCWAPAKLTLFVSARLYLTSCSHLLRVHKKLAPVCRKSRASRADRRTHNGRATCCAEPAYYIGSNRIGSVRIKAPSSSCFPTYLSN